MTTAGYETTKISLMIYPKINEKKTLTFKQIKAHIIKNIYIKRGHWTAKWNQNNFPVNIIKFVIILIKRQTSFIRWPRFCRNLDVSQPMAEERHSRMRKNIVKAKEEIEL